jgi:Fe2+ or Zn2+ uptake regulation protein
MKIEKTEDIVQKNIYILPINEQYIQKDLTGRNLPEYRLELTEAGFLVLKTLYFSFKPITHGMIYAKLNGKLSMSSIRRAIDLFENKKIIQRKQAFRDSNIGHTMADSRYKYYEMTQEGEEEYENQVKRKKWI